MVVEQMTSSSPEGSGHAAMGGSRMTKGFVCMRDVDGFNHKENALIDVLGCVTSVRHPIPCRGGDYKMAVYMTDKSLEAEGARGPLCLNIFLRDEASMPTFNLADVVLVKGAKVQKPRNGLDYSLLYTFKTAIHIYRAKMSSPAVLDIVPWSPRSRFGTAPSAPSPIETAYAYDLHKSINKSALPDITTFEDIAAKSLHVRDKRRELKDVSANSYCDMLVQVVADPYISDFPYAMLWVSDYTENVGFERYGSPLAERGEHHQVGDSNGFVTKFAPQMQHQQKPANWSGPLGKRSMQVVCYTPHAEFIEKNVKRNCWVELKNVQVRVSRSGDSLEGTMREDPDQGSPLRVSMVETLGIDPKEMDPRLIAALRRKQQYNKNQKSGTKKRKEVHDNKADEGRAPNAKQRRSLDRRGKKEPSQKDSQAKDQKQGQTKDQARDETKAVVSQTHLPNDAIVSDFCSQSVTPLSCVLDPGCYSLGERADMRLPFVNIKFKAQVRVVDFLPNRLLDFATSHQISESEILESIDGPSSSSSSSEESDGGAGERVWEWRFALLLEDASALPNNSSSRTVGSSSPPPRPRIWAVVDNLEGQMLTGLDASDLRRDNRTLGALREKMFFMWGNLEELKLDAERQRAAAEVAARAAERVKIRKKNAEQAAKDKLERDRQRVAQTGTSLAHYPAPVEATLAVDEEDEDDDQTESHAQQLGREQQAKQAQAEFDERVVSNRPFVCCIRQYGIWGRADNEGKGARDEETEDEESGPKKSWRQMFGIFGTTIKG